MPPPPPPPPHSGPSCGVSGWRWVWSLAAPVVLLVETDKQVMVIKSSTKPGIKGSKKKGTKHPKMRKTSTSGVRIIYADNNAAKGKNPKKSKKRDGGGGCAGGGGGGCGGGCGGCGG